MRVRSQTSLAVNHMRDNWKQILKLLLGTGLVLVDSNRRQKVRNRVSDFTDVARDKYEDLRDVARDRYDDAADRVERFSDAIHGRQSHMGQIGGFLVGMGVGVGLGMLFAPASGEETRQTIRDQASDWKDRVSQQAANIRERASEKASQFREQSRDIPRDDPYSRPA